MKKTLNCEFVSINDLSGDSNIIEQMTSHNSNLNKNRLLIIAQHIKNGVMFKTLDNVYIDEEVVIGKGTIIFANNHLRGNTVIGKDCILDCGNTITDAELGNKIKVSQSTLTDCKIGNNTTIGPNAHIHTRSHVERDCRVGNFVELKNCTLGINTKVAHLAYVGDADIGNQCNIGCGSIFVNYDGKNKHRSHVGDSVFIGSNSNVIAPVKIEDNAFIAAGTTVTVDLPKDCMCIGRSHETIKENRSKYRKGDYIKKYFGTDGIRGLYNEFINENLAYMCGNFLGYSSDGGKIMVGRDTRPSGQSLSNALIQGIIDAGADVYDLGVSSTPNVAFSTSQFKANYGIVISASHNPYQYNGIKIFNYDGRKLTNIEEIEIEKHIEKNQAIIRDEKGVIYNGEHFINKYLLELEKLIGKLDGLKVVLDCSNGAVGLTAPEIFTRLGCDVICYNTLTDGVSINDGCGALFPHICAEKVLQAKADIGFCFDGDADRIIAIDASGTIIDGDSIIYIISKYLHSIGKLNNNMAVGTLHTNLGVEKSLAQLGITLHRTDIGDHFVMEKMLRDDIIVGGEQSGHIILREFSNTGDGVLAGLYLAKLIKTTSQTLCQMDDSEHYPQVNLNIVSNNKKTIMTDHNLQEFVNALTNEIQAQGRILLRASGTEPKIRIMAECVSQQLAQETADKLYNYITSNFEI